MRVSPLPCDPYLSMAPITTITGKKLFSTNAEFEVALRSGGKSVVTRYPTDQEWADRSRAIKTSTSKIAKGTQTKSTGVEEADAALLAILRVSGADTDEFEANALIGKLMKAEAAEARAVPEGFEIVVSVVGGIATRHTLRVPSERELRAYRKAAFVWVDMRHGRQELRTAPLEIGELYNKLTVKTEGYAEGSEIPLAHKTAAVIELTQAVDALDAEDDPETFI